MGEIENEGAPIEVGEIEYEAGKVMKEGIVVGVGDSVGFFVAVGEADGENVGAVGVNFVGVPDGAIERFSIVN